MAKVSLIDAGPIAQGLFTLVDSLFTSDDERLAAKFKIMELEASGALAQLNVNAVEAQHNSVFVAGWRPFVGWIGGLSLASLTVLSVLVAFDVVDLSVYQAITGAFMTSTLPILGGMLGLRTFDKYQGTDTKFVGDGIDRRAKG